jgi:outer membrane receptor protein involved in Fe transport
MRRAGILVLPLLAAQPALAADPPPKPAAPGKTVEGVTVTAASPQGLRTSIDRKSYGITGDLQATTGSIGDALRNIPSVDVDVQGNVSLRGDPNVTIMIDGKPSGLFRGEARGQALQNLPASQFERVEVITNPSAEFKPDGSGGIINLISKANRKRGWSGSVRANLGSEGRYNGGAGGGYNSGRLTLSGDVSLRHDPQKFDQQGRRQTPDSAGGDDTSAYRFGQRGQGHIVSGRGSADYDLDPKTRIGAEARLTRMAIHIDNFEQQVDTNPEGDPVRGYQRTGPQRFVLTNTEGQLSWRRTLPGDGHVLSASLRRERTDFANGRQARLEALIPASVTLEDLVSNRRIDETEAKANYARPLGPQAKLKVGYDFGDETFDWNNVVARGATAQTLALDPGQTDRFEYRQTTHAAYVTYERTLGDLTAQAGLRVEAVRLAFRQATLGQSNTRHTLDAYPTLHLAYRLDERQELTASYSRRIVRPRPEDLDPFRQYVDPSTQREGDPNLKPQLTDSYEAAYAWRKGSTLYQATLAYRDSRRVVANVVSELDGGAVLIQRRGVGQRQSLVLELVANGRLTSNLTYNLSGTLAHDHIDAGNLGFDGGRNGTAVGGRATLNWQATPKDLVQLNGAMLARQLLPQGHELASGILNLGYRHKVSDDLSLLVTVNDALDTTRRGQVYDTPAIRQRTTYRANVRSIFVGAVWTFGGAAKRRPEPGFDFGQGGGPPG